MNVPVGVGREEARRLAERELDEPAYGQNESWADKLQQWLDDVLSRLDDIFDDIQPTDSTVGGWFGLVVIVLIVVLVIVLVRYRAGTMQRARRRSEAALLEPVQFVSAAQQRNTADEYATGEEWAEAIRARMRAIALALEERALLDRRPGRTADEVASDAAPALPDHAGELRRAARIFDDVWYGGHTADRELYGEITDIDERLAAAKPTLTGAAR
ncbi:MAG: DUF4129 domain-containing protein [Streptosporangiales bacterium]|nr:DUF4129 domain-containing protein [Streptosporangiales bacterium]